MAKPVIVTRLDKGDPLSYNEMDNNFTNLRDATITLAADSGTPQALDLNDTLTVAGGTGISTVVSETDTVTVNLEDTAVTAGSYTAATVTVDAQGRITAASSNSIPTAVSELTNDSGYITDVSQDTTPSLGGNLTGGDFTVSDIELFDYKETVYSLGSTDSPSIDVANGNVQTVTIASSLALPAFSNAETGQSVTLIVTGTGTASGTAAYKFAAGATDLTNFSIVSIFYDGSTYWASISTDYV